MCVYRGLEIQSSPLPVVAGSGAAGAGVFRGPYGWRKACVCNSSVKYFRGMEKELGVPKPGDLLIGAIDFFAVLVPGVIAAALIVIATGRDLEQASSLFVAGLVTAGWVLGHVLHGIGSFLDPLLYDRLFKPADTVAHEAVKHKYFHKNDELYRLAKEMTDAPHGQDSHATGARVPGGMYQWARAWLNSHNPKATADLDRLEADSKLFRSLAVLLLIPVLMAAPVLFPPAADHRLVLLALIFALLLFSLWRYCDLRNKMIRQCYLNYVQLRFESRQNQRAASAAE
jgi:hypothetical protein